MSASFRSHFKSTPQPIDISPDVPRKQSSRMPKKSTSSTEPKSKAAQHVSNFAKRASRNVTPSDKSEQGTRHNAKRAPTPVAAAVPDPSAAPRRLSVVPQSEDAHAGSHAQPAYRHNTPAIRTPSLVSGSTASTFDSPRSNMLRKKPSGLEGYASSKRADGDALGLGRATTHSRNEVHRDDFDDTVFGISMPSSQQYSRPDASSSGPIPDSHGGWHVTRDITPPMAAYAPSTTPSTRYTDSPFSHVPTPSSASSYSPAVMVTASLTGRATPQSPPRSRPPISGKAGATGDDSHLGLPSVRESSTSSSNSTVKPPMSSKVPPRKEVPRKPSRAEAPSVARTPSYARPTVSSTQSAKPPVSIPPELAHLNVDHATKPSINKPLPPLRPSRDNTPSITDMSAQNRVVQSDLPSLYTTYHKRTPSQETPISTSSSSFRQRLGLSSRGSSMQPSPRIDSAISPPPSAKMFARAPTPDNHPPETRRLQRKDSPAIGPAPSPSKSPRFGFFSRKSKVDVNKPTEKPKRQPTKGPAAGTGHEGYSRFNPRGRSGSATSSTDFRSPSTDSNASSAPRPTTSRKGSFGSSRDGSALDDEFLRERQTPVILRGSGSTFSNNASVSDMQSSVQSSARDSSNTSSVDSYAKPQLLPSAMQHQAGISPVKRPPMSRRAPSDSSQDDVSARYPTLAAWRSFNRLSQADGKAPVRVPAPIDTGLAPKQQSMDSYDNDASAWPATDSTLPGAEDQFASHERMQRDAQQANDAKPPRRWNFFQRAHASPRPKGKQRAVDSDSTHHTETIGRPYDTMAHYAMLDPVEPVDLYEVEQLVQGGLTFGEESMSETQPTSKIVPYEQRHSSLLPSPPKDDLRKAQASQARPTPPKIMVRTDSTQSPSPELLRAQAAVPQKLPHIVDIPRSPATVQEEQSAVLPHYPRNEAKSTPEMQSAPFEASNESSPRQPRLSPVGRIPQVVSKRDRDRKLPDNSFSRPFVRTQPHPSVKPPGALYNQIRELASPIESGSGGSQPVSSTSTRSEGLPAEQKGSVTTESTNASTNRTSMDVHGNPEFMIFPRKGSQVSYSSSSGNGSWMAPLIVQPPQMDDPWAEYNDLLDDMLPQKTPISAGSSLGAPFQYSGMLHDSTSPAVPTPLNFNYSSPPPMAELPPPPRSQTVPAPLSVPQQIARFMQPSMSPLTTPHTISDLLDQYGDRSSAHLTSNRSSIPLAARSNASQGNRASLPVDARASMSSSRYSKGSGHSRSASLPEANFRNSQSSLTPSARFRRDTQLLDIAEDSDDDQAALANLRFGALMTSKWLSFGRVLFSPAHNEMKLANEPKVLVLDGLGSDWSYYVALTYPAATVYNLGPAPTNGSTSWPGINQKPPANHKHYVHGNIASAFPFPKGFFTAVLFRFPIASSDAAYHACIYECKRVLRPGGHLEIAVLDLDLMNMGSRTRSVVRGLKTRMQAQESSVSLRNLSDVLIRLIGRRGFEEVQRCVVGVPVAGRIPTSQDNSSRSSGDNHLPTRTRASNEPELSFSDLLSEARNSQIEAPSEGSDEGITKMVAKVGRWWYSTCYETSLLQQGEKSIWADQALLRECQKQGTSLRLLIAHAQKPAQTRRRTVSV